jgi:hypothetical protein
MLHAYLDDSGTHDSSPVCVVAGYFGTDVQWARFDAQWRFVLQSYGIEEFHASRFWAHCSGANISEYKELDEEKSSRLIRSLLEVIALSRRIYPIGCSVDMNEWTTLTKEERAVLTGAAFDDNGKLLTNGASNKTFFLPFLTTIASALDHCKWGHLMHFTLDASERYASYARDYYSEVRKLRQGNYLKMGELTFSDSKKAAPIQAADLLAYEVNQHHVRILRNGKTSPTLAMVYAMRNAKQDAIPYYEKVAFAKSLATFRRALARQHPNTVIEPK